MITISVALLCCRCGLLFIKMRAVYLRELLSNLDDGEKKPIPSCQGQPTLKGSLQGLDNQLIQSFLSPKAKTKSSRPKRKRTSCYRLSLLSYRHRHSHDFVVSIRYAQ